MYIVCGNILLELKKIFLLIVFSPFFIFLCSFFLCHLLLLIDIFIYKGEEYSYNQDI